MSVGFVRDMEVFLENAGLTNRVTVRLSNEVTRPVTVRVYGGKWVERERERGIERGGERERGRERREGKRKNYIKLSTFSLTL